ncbi:hypothetical protein QTP88_026695 [Uroleucon formosanum]
MKINLKIPKLQKNAIPCLFAGPKYLSNPQKKRKSPTKRVSLGSNCRNSKSIKLTEVDSKLSETVINKDALNQETSVFLQSSIIPTIEYFKNMCREIELTKPPDNWKYEINREKNTSITFYIVQCNENEVGVFIEKQISLEMDMIVKCKLYNVFVDIQDICPKLKVLTFDELILVINAVNTKQCDRFRIAFRMKKSRLSAGKSTRLLLSPSKKISWIHFIIKNTIVKLLQNHLNEFKEKLNKLSDASFENIIIENKLNDSQSTLIREIVSASKYKNPKKRRYSENWMLEQELMPLPCTSTIRKHLSIVKTDCGFDLRFFDLLKKRMFRKPQNQRHGVLLFDKIQLRKRLYVNTHDLSNSGLGDMGGEADVSEKKANHGLVFFYQGIVLAQLMLKAIALLESSRCFIDGIICDGAPINRKMWTELGISGKLGEFMFFFFSDAPHLFKNVRNHLHDKKYLKVNPEGKCISWWHYIEAFNADVIHPGNARAIPKITKEHLYLSNLMKTRVRLMTQVFSHSMVCGIEFYRCRKGIGLGGSEETQKCTILLNNLFDTLNRRYAAKGITKSSKNFKIMEDAEIWLDNWETNVKKTKLSQNEFLTSPAEGLRVTIRSSIELSKYLLYDCGFSYVLTGKMNQDPLEKFFGMIRQAAGPNDHSTGTTFLHLYRILSIYSVLRPPKSGNCTILDCQAPKISLSELKDIFNCESIVRQQKIIILNSKVDLLVDEGSWEADEVFQNHNYNEASVLNCIIYYTTGYVSKKIAKNTYCTLCLSALIVKDKFVDLPEAELINIKSKEGLTHPNINLFHFLSNVEECFAKYCKQKNVFDLTVEDSLHYAFSFPCKEHKNNVVTSILSNYIVMRMRHFAVQDNRQENKKSREKKKIAKLIYT